jgi:miniconductance mechanosensitive channel
MNREYLYQYTELIKGFLLEQGFTLFWANLLNAVAMIVIVAVAVLIIDFITRNIIVQLFKAFSDRSRTSFDNFLVQSNFPRFISHFIPLGIIGYLYPVIFVDFPMAENVCRIALQIYLVILCILVFRSILRTTNNYLRESSDKYADKPLESYVQVLMIFAWGVGIFFFVNILTGYSLKSLATLSAASAIILLIFKDTILGFVASIQVSVNDIVRIGDWITFSKYGADGMVTEINLATVRVKNWDNTFTSIPTYSLIADSFQNWRGMQESGGRRIKRSIYIKQNSVRFVDPEQLEKLKAIELIKPYIEHREKDIRKHNERVSADKSLLINGRNQTNLGIFRKYIDAYLHELPAINKDLYLMVRHQQPTDKGIPVEILCFSRDKVWQNYEAIQSDLFDHILSAAPYFGLEIFELPSTRDIEGLQSPGND